MYFDDLTGLLVSAGGRLAPAARLPRRAFLQLVGGVVLAGPPVLALAEEDMPAGSYRVQAAWAAGELQKFRAVLEVRGQLRWKPEKKDIQEAPFEAQGELVYVERLLSGDALRRSVRHYEQAEVEYLVGKQSNKRRISEHQRLILAQREAGPVLLTCPQQPMTRDELDLLDIPGNTLALAEILPAGPVRIGDSWDVPAAVVAALLVIDEVSETTLSGTLRRVEENMAVLEYSGMIRGIVQGAKTEMKLTAKGNFDLATRNLTWFALAIREQREISDALPGLEATARLRLVAQPSEVIEPLNDEIVATLPPPEDPNHQVLKFVSEQNHFELLMDRRWRVIVDRSDVTILRLFEAGSLIAQAVVSPLPDGPPDKDLALTSFQDEVKQSLGKHAGQILEAAEGTGDGGIRVLRVTAAGVVSEVSMQWVYYHVSNTEGRRTAFAFTVQTDLIEKFGERDRAMLATFAFQPRPEASVTPKVEAARLSPSSTPAKTKSSRR